MEVQDKVVIELSKFEALVLFDCLPRIFKATPPLTQPEVIALQILESALESILSEPFEKNYTELVESARRRSLEG